MVLPSLPIEKTRLKNESARSELKEIIFLSQNDPGQINHTVLKQSHVLNSKWC